MEKGGYEFSENIILREEKFRSETTDTTFKLLFTLFFWRVPAWLFDFLDGKLKVVQLEISALASTHLMYSDRSEFNSRVNNHKFGKKGT